MQKSLGFSLRLTAVFVLHGLGLAACSKNTGLDSNTLRVAVKDEVKTLDPANAYDTVSLDILPNIEEPLFQYRYLEDAMELEPLVAESLPEYSKDGRTVTVKVKKGLRFHDDPCFKANGGKGRELKAKDFIFAFKRLAMPGIQSQGAWIFEDKVLGFKAFGKKLQAAKPDEFKKVFDEPIEGFTAKDDYTLEFKLTQPYPVLNYILAMSFTSPVAFESAEAYADKDGNLRDHPIGTGAFMLKSWETGQRVVLTRNPDYPGTYPTTASAAWKARGFLQDAGKPIPFFTTLSFEIIKEESTRMAKFEKGEIDTLELNKDTFRALMTDADHVREDLAKKGVQADFENSLVMYYVAFNMKDKLLQNKYLRQAISSSIDRVQWMDTFEKYRSTLQDQVTPPGLLDRVDGAKLKYDYDLERAKALLAKAGYPEGRGLPVLTFDFRGAETRFRQMGEMFVQQLGAIGIKVNPILNTFPAYLEKAKQGTTQLSLGGWTFDYPDVENGYQLLYGPNQAPGPNDGNWSHPTFDAIYRKIAVLPAGAKGRKELVKQAEDLIQEECPWAYGYYLKTYRIHQGRVKNDRMIELIQNKYKYLRLEDSKNP